jgi:hypothetical protein
VIPSRNELKPSLEAQPLSDSRKSLITVAASGIPSSKETSPIVTASTPFTSNHPSRPTVSHGETTSGPASHREHIGNTVPSSSNATTPSTATTPTVNKDKKKKKVPTDTIVAQPSSKTVKKNDFPTVWNNENGQPSSTSSKKKEVPNIMFVNNSSSGVPSTKDDKKLFVKAARPKQVQQLSPPPSIRSKSKMSLKPHHDGIDVLASPRSPRTFDISLAPTDELVAPIRGQKTPVPTKNNPMVMPPHRAQPYMPVDVKASVSSVSFKHALMGTSKVRESSNPAPSPYSKPSKRERHIAQNETLTKSTSTNTVLYQHPSNGSVNANIALQQLPKLLQQQQQLQQLQHATLMDNNKPHGASARKPRKSSNIVVLSKNLAPSTHALAYEMSNRPSTSAGTYDGHHVHHTTKPSTPTYNTRTQLTINQMGQLPPSPPTQREKIVDAFFHQNDSNNTHMYHV